MNSYQEGYAMSESDFKRIPFMGKITNVFTILREATDFQEVSGLSLIERGLCVERLQELRVKTLNLCTIYAHKR